MIPLASAILSFKYTKKGKVIFPFYFSGEEKKCVLAIKRAKTSKVPKRGESYTCYSRNNQPFFGRVTVSFWNFSIGYKHK